MRKTVLPTTAADRSESGTGRCPITDAVFVVGSNAWTLSVPALDPPPKITSLPPIIAAAASWKTFGVEPRLATSPVRASNENTPPTEVSEESSPPARYTIEPSATATSR
jgi:hypothetical protein